MKFRRDGAAVALPDYDQVLRLDPNNVEGLRGRSSVLIVLGRREDAFADLSRVLQLEPRNVGARVRRALNGLHPDPAGVIADLTTAIEIDPSDGGLIMTLAGIREGRGDLAGAVADLTRAIGVLRRPAGAYNRRAAVRERQGDLEGAFADYGEAIRLDPRNADAMLARGQLWFATGHHVEAVADLSMLLGVWPEHNGAHLVRSDARLAIGDIRGALADLEQPTERANTIYAPDVIRARRGVARLLGGDVVAAREEFGEALRQNPRNDVALAYRCIMQHRQGNTPAAETDCATAIQVAEHEEDDDQRIGWPHAARAGARLIANDLGGAAAVLNESLRPNPREAYALHLRSLLRASRGDQAGAAEDAAAARRLRPNVAAEVVAIFGLTSLAAAGPGDSATSTAAPK